MNRDLCLEAEAYALRHGLELTGMLGDGPQGSVWKVRGKGKLITWAMKIQASSADYRRERDCYLRLGEHGVTELEGFHVPSMIRCDDECRVIEMSIVAQPFVVDFAQAYLDQAPTFDPEVWQDTYAAWESRFEGDWQRVGRLLRGLEELGIYYLDVHRGNISIG